nr:centrosomal protein of 126 kDa isoform X2 [Dasypus novemcinctus]
MLAGRPGARSAAAEASDSRGGAPPSPRGAGRPRPGAYLDMKIYLEKNLEEERQVLLQQQKICRNRARKYFVESNRRKKAFEEKHKEQEEREHQMREQILQQRKQKFEEVTEKFQRGFIPLSQRRRTVFRKPVPPLEEALKQIQGSNLKSEVSFPSSHRPTINWRAIDSALSTALSKNDHKHQKHLTSKINCDKEMKENSMANLATHKDAFQLKLEEAQKLLEDQHLSSLQKFCDEVYQITNSETLSSIDSLEAGEHEEIYLTLNKEPSTSVQKNSIYSKSANLQSTNLSCFDEDKLSFSKIQHINNWLINLNDPDTHTVAPVSNILSKPDVLPSCEHFNSQEQNPSTLSKTMEKTANSASSVAFVCSPHVFEQDEKSKKTSETSTVRTADSFSGTFERERPLVTESSAFKSSKAWTTPDSLTQEGATFSDQEKYSELIQENRTTSINTSFVPMVAPLVLPFNTQSARPLPKDCIHIKEIDPVQCSDKLDEVKLVKDKKINCFNYNKQELPLFVDDFQATCIPHNTDSKEKQKVAEASTSLSNVIAHYDLDGHHKKMKFNIHERNGVRLLKSILKKESKYEHDYFKALIINRDFKFGNQKAAAIRDSIELTKEKGKGEEIPKTIKKLRWFDEIGNTENNAEDYHSLKNRTGTAQHWSQPFHIQTKSGAVSTIISVPACAVNSSDSKKPPDDFNSKNVAALEGSVSDHVPLNCSISSGYNFANQAWLSSKKEESKFFVNNGDSKIQKTNLQRGRTKVTRRTRSAKAHSCVSYTNRKGTGIRSQSASKANTLIETQGKLIVPHPPPKPTSNVRNGKNMKVSQCQSMISENSQNNIAHNCFHFKHVLPSEHNLNQWNQSSPLLSDTCSDLDTVMPSLPSYCPTECQTSAQVSHSHGTQMVAQRDGALRCTQRCPVSGGLHHCAALRPPGGEPAPLGKKGHNTLNQGERADDSAVTRRKRIVKNKQKGLFEHKRQNPGSVGQKYSEKMQNLGQNVQLSSSEPKQTIRGTSNIEEVSDSTSEFLMAENLVKSSIPEDEILAVMNSKQPQKTNLSLNKIHRLNICMLSAEEQKILQSLNRLNERLYNVQETICKNPSIRNTLQIIPFLAGK